VALVKVAANAALDRTAVMIAAAAIVVDFFILVSPV
jgi:hypothetical protein